MNFALKLRNLLYLLLNSSITWRRNSSFSNLELVASALSTRGAPKKNGRAGVNLEHCNIQNTANLTQTSLNQTLILPALTKE